MFSISRFAILSVEFGPTFIVQFLLLTLLFGIPLLLFFVSTGQYLGSGIIDMWRISPIFQVRIRCSLFKAIFVLVFCRQTNFFTLCYPCSFSGHWCGVNASTRFIWDIQHCYNILVVYIPPRFFCYSI